MNLGQTIVNIRKEKKMTQEEFAQLFHVTRQTVSNWENEKNYPDLETLVYMSNEFNISLDVMLKEDTQMVKTLSMEIKFSKKFKQNIVKFLLCIIIVLSVGAIGWGIVWSDAKDSLEAKFGAGIEANGFYLDERLGYYKKMIAQDTYYTLPNQSLPEYFQFSLHFYAATLDYYTTINGENIQIRWSETNKKADLLHSISYLDENGCFEYSLSEKQENELCEKNPNIVKILQEGANIYKDVYE